MVACKVAPIANLIAIIAIIIAIIAILIAIVAIVLLMSAKRYYEVFGSRKYASQYAERLVLVYFWFFNIWFSVGSLGLTRGRAYMGLATEVKRSGNNTLQLLECPSLCGHNRTRANQVGVPRNPQIPDSSTMMLLLFAITLHLSGSCHQLL